MGSENFCLQCEHIWHGVNDDHCPKCGSNDVTSEDDWDNGHFEGDMFNGTTSAYDIKD